MVHPPYAVRVAALLKAARRLRFDEYARELQKLSASWESSRWRGEETNRYHLLADIEVVEGLINGTFQFCEQLGLRLWANSRISQPPEGVGGSGDQGFGTLGTDLLVSAWLAFSRRGQEGYPLGVRDRSSHCQLA
jgi:hypothetical protein